MNTLSWLLYAADALDGLKTIFSTLVVLSASTAALLTFGWLAGAREDKEVSPKPAGAMFGIALALAILACLIPSRETVHMIAASELAERAVASQDGREMIELLKKRVRSALEQEGER